MVVHCRSLLLPGERKSIELMAARIDPEHVRRKHQSMHHFIADAPWSDDAVLKTVIDYALPIIETSEPIVRQRKILMHMDRSVYNTVELISYEIMNITIVAAHFMPEIGYKEVIMARVLARQGHRVTVITTALVSPKKISVVSSVYRTGVETTVEGAKIIRLPHSWKLGSMVKSRTLLLTLENTSPDFVFAIGIGKLFPDPVLLPVEKRDYRLIAYFGDHEDYFPNLSGKQRIINARVWLGKKIFKQLIVRRAINNCDLVVGYTPDTKSILDQYCTAAQSKVLSKKYFEIPLGYDSKEYYFDEEGRKEQRDELGVTDREILIVSVTRLTPPKQIELVIMAISELLKRGVSLRYCIIGALGDSYEEYLKKVIDQTGEQDRIAIYPFLSSKEQRNYYNAADLGIWVTAAITIQEAMGTGLRVLLPNKPSVNHLVTNGENGWIFDSLSDSLNAAVSFLLHQNTQNRKADRLSVENMNRANLSYDMIIKSIFHRCETRDRHSK